MVPKLLFSSYMSFVSAFVTIFNLITGSKRRRYVRYGNLKPKCKMNSINSEFCVRIWWDLVHNIVPLWCSDGQMAWLRRNSACPLIIFACIRYWTKQCPLLFNYNERWSGELSRTPFINFKTMLRQTYASIIVTCIG